MNKTRNFHGNFDQQKLDQRTIQIGVDFCSKSLEIQPANNGDLTQTWILTSKSLEFQRLDDSNRDSTSAEDFVNRGDPTQK
jgi:hypothetical protein